MNFSPVTVIVVHGQDSAAPVLPANAAGVDDIRTGMSVLLRKLQSARKGLADLAQGLPEPADAMLEEEVPFDVSAEMLTTVQHVLAAYIDPAMDKLSHLTGVTEEQLFEEWQSRKPSPPAPLAAPPSRPRERGDK
jgi:hypothetical protein